MIYDTIIAIDSSNKAVQFRQSAPGSKNPMRLGEFPFFLTFFPQFGMLSACSKPHLLIGVFL
jgi:hypothetical protein